MWHQRNYQEILHQKDRNNILQLDQKIKERHQLSLKHQINLFHQEIVINWWRRKKEKVINVKVN